MTRVHDRPRVPEHDDVVAEKLIREAFPETEVPHEPPIAHPPAETEAETPGRPIRWMRWLAATVGVIALAVVAAIVITGDDSTTPIETAGVPEVAEFHTADWWEHMLAPAPTATAVEFHTADWWEHMLAPASTATAVGFHTADWWEHVMAPTMPVMDSYRTADGWERYFGSLEQVRDELITRY